MIGDARYVPLSHRILKAPPDTYADHVKVLNRYQPLLDAYCYLNGYIKSLEANEPNHGLLHLYYQSWHEIAIWERAIHAHKLFTAATTGAKQSKSPVGVRRIKVLQLHEQGIKSKEIAKQLGIADAKVRAITKAYGDTWVKVTMAGDGTVKQVFQNGKVKTRSPDGDVTIEKAPRNK